MMRRLCSELSGRLLHLPSHSFPERGLEEFHEAQGDWASKACQSILCLTSRQTTDQGESFSHGGPCPHARLDGPILFDLQISCWRVAHHRGRKSDHTLRTVIPLEGGRAGRKTS